MVAKRLRSPGPGNDGIPQHAAAPQRFWESAPFRTAVQGVAIDVILALALLIVQATSGETVDWRLLLAMLGKTLVYTAASGVMKRVKPRKLTDRAAS